MNKLINIVLLSSLIIITGCSNNPTFGDRMFAEGESRFHIAEQWEEGKNNSIKGEKKIRNGRELIEDGRTYLREGEQLIVTGNMQVKANRQAYQELSQAANGIDSGEAALNRVAKLKKIAKKWEDGEDMIAKGNKLIQRGNTNITEGEANILDGQELITKGRKKMQNAESNYL